MILLPINEKLITFERQQAYCQGALVVQDPLDPTNNVTAGCFSYSTLQNEFRKAQVRVQSQYLEFRSLSLSVSTAGTMNKKDDNEAISVLGALFDVPHHQNVVRYTGTLWCPPEITLKQRNFKEENIMNKQQIVQNDIVHSEGECNSNEPFSIDGVGEHAELQHLRERNSLLAAENDYLKERLKLDNQLNNSNAMKTKNSFSLGMIM